MSYKYFESNQSIDEPQFKSLSQVQINQLKEQQIRLLSSYFNISGKESDLLWMAMTPAKFLRYERLKINQIGYYVIDWGRPDEYGEDTCEITVKSFVIGVQCTTCNCGGKYETWEQGADMDQPPIISYDMCDKCDGTGVYHYSNKILNRIRLSENEFRLKEEHDSYFDELENKLNSDRYASAHYSTSPVYDEDNPDPYSPDWPGDNDEDEKIK
ncbi:hypothetical protein [Nitrosomonas communis]|nr:hypothetical protein [Nitrosomonas communis]